MDKEYEVKLEFTGIETIYVSAKSKKEAIELAEIDSNMKREGAEVSVYEVNIVK